MAIPEAASMDIMTVTILYRILYIRLHVYYSPCINSYPYIHIRRKKTFICIWLVCFYTKPGSGYAEEIFPYLTYYLFILDFSITSPQYHIPKKSTHPVHARDGREGLDAGAGLFLGVDDVHESVGLLAPHDDHRSGKGRAGRRPQLFGRPLVVRHVKHHGRRTPLDGALCLQEGRTDHMRFFFFFFFFLQFLITEHTQGGPWYSDVTGLGF